MLILRLFFQIFRPLSPPASRVTLLYSLSMVSRLNFYDFRLGLRGRPGELFDFRSALLRLVPLSLTSGPSQSRILKSLWMCLRMLLVRPLRLFRTRLFPTGGRLEPLSLLFLLAT